MNHRLNHSLKKELQSHLQSVLSLHHGNLKLFVETTFKGFFSYLHSSDRIPSRSRIQSEILTQPYIRKSQHSKSLNITKYSNLSLHSDNKKTSGLYPRLWKRHINEMLIESGWYCHTHVHAILVYKLTVSIFYSVHSGEFWKWIQHCFITATSILVIIPNLAREFNTSVNKYYLHRHSEHFHKVIIALGDSPKFSHCSQWRKNRMEISGPFRLSAISSPLRFKCTSYYSKSSFFCRREPQDCPSLISGNAELAKVTNLKLWRKWNYCRDDFLNLSAEL